MQELKGRVAVVTGGASGMGAGMCRAFAREGMAVAVADLDAQSAEKLAAELRDKGARSIAVGTDVSRRADVERLAERTLRELGGVDVVCKNAGVFIGGTMAEMTDDDWRWVLSVNLDGVYYGCQVFAPILRERGRGGHIVNTASVGGFLSAPIAAAYSVSKFGVVAFSEALRAELAPHHIGVSALCPGPVRSRLSDSDARRPAHLGKAGNRSPVLWDMIKEGIEPDAVGPIVVRGIRDDAPYIFTHVEWRDALRKRFDAVLAAFDRVP
jgi:NAD(P)-dependent dehydrogenase (short-subunit alcohol dehydrogenase family)